MLHGQGSLPSGGHLLEVFTDRTLYIAGEKVMVSGWLGAVAGEASQDRVLYCELITPGGLRIASAKFPLGQGRAEGCLGIPEDALTGNYYLKCYTRTMRNGPLDNYSFLMITVVNPYRPEVLEGNGGSMASPAVPDRLSTGPGDSLCRMELPGEAFSPRDTVSLSVIWPGGMEGAGYACLTVVPVDAFRETAKPDMLPGTAELAARHVPESRGISMSGTLADNASGKPVEGSLVYLSVIGRKDFIAIRTDSAGRFFFALPALSGSHDIFLCAEEHPDRPCSILIDNDFCTKPLSLPAPRFSLSGPERQLALQMASNLSIRNVYYADSLPAPADDTIDGQPFYGHPNGTLRIDNYIELPTLEEYFNELPFGVKVRKEAGRKEFRFLSSHADMTVYDPLVLVDWVAVNDVDRVLAMPPREVDRIELVSVPYVKGSITYGGIISFISKNNDFAGIDLPSSGTFVSYRFFSECPGMPVRQGLPPNMPDSRNTVFWDPALEPGSAGSAQIAFDAPATPGNYLVLLRWIDGEGRRHAASKTFIVR